MMKSMSSDSLVSIPFSDSSDHSMPNGTYVELKKFYLYFDYNDKMYQITFVNQKIGTGKEQALDLSKLSPEEIEVLKNQAKRTMAAMEKLSGRPEGLLGTSFTLHFSSTYNEPTLINKAAALLRIERFQYKENPFEIDSITYKDASGVEQKFTVDLSRYNPASKQKIMGEIQPLNALVQRAFHRTVYNAEPLTFGEHKAITPAKQEHDMTDLVPTDEDEQKLVDPGMSSKPLVTVSIRSDDDDDLEARLAALKKDD